MKKNITINLCGRLFQIDEDAYELLQQYINSLRSAFGKQADGDEIVDDIEARVAELFDELRQQGIEAITIEHVTDIITRIGKPEELMGEEVQSSDNTAGSDERQSQSFGQKIHDNLRDRTDGKKLYRNPKDKMVAGVMSGIAVYTNTDPVIWRFLTVVFTLFYGVGIIIYIVLALVIPEARTPEQLLQMEGRDVTPQNLADVVVEKEKQPVSRPSFARLLFSLLIKLVIGFTIFILIFVCFAFLIAFLFTLIAAVSGLVLPLESSLPFSLSSMGFAGAWIHNPKILIMFVIALFFVLLIPVYALIHMLLSFGKKVRPMGIAQRIIWIVLWLAALCTVVPLGFTIAEYDNDYIEEHFKANDNRFKVYQGVEMSEEDADFLRRGGWTLIKAENCVHYTWKGRDVLGNNKRYLDTYNEDCEAVYQVEHKEKVDPGLYMVRCLARAEGPGACVYAVGNETIIKTIPVNEGRIGSTGDGWNYVTIDSIRVTGDSIAYGVSSDSSFTGRLCQAKYFSATDFTLQRIDEASRKE